MKLLLILMMMAPLFALPIGGQLPPLALKGDEGGKVDGTPFDSETLRGKVHSYNFV